MLVLAFFPAVGSVALVIDDDVLEARSPESSASSTVFALAYFSLSLKILFLKDGSNIVARTRYLLLSTSLNHQFSKESISSFIVWTSRSSLMSSQLLQRALTKDIIKDTEALSLEIDWVTSSIGLRIAIITSMMAN